jgi:hypothetical protein
VHHRFAARQVRRYAKKVLPSVFDQRLAAVLHQQPPHPAAPRQSDDRNGIVRDRIPFESAQELLDHHIGRMAERDRGGNHRAHAGSGHEVDRNSRFGKGLNHADMSKCTRAAAG